jgi:bifunctional DNA-binding transcriptional regulator/antitoxin component of YhaV-PrlF toxin-antitoxin module
MSVRYLSDTQATVTVRKDGRITIPKRFIKALGWENVRELDYELQEDGSIVFTRPKQYNVDDTPLYL